MISSLDLLRYNASTTASNAVSSTQLSKALEKTKDGLGKTNEDTKSFDSYLMDAISYVNDTQNKSSALFEQVIIDQDSVDVHDVTGAMAQANLSLSLAQAVIDRMIKGWSEITTTR